MARLAPRPPDTHERGVPRRAPKPRAAARTAGSDRGNKANGARSRSQRTAGTEPPKSYAPAGRGGRGGPGGKGGETPCNPCGPGQATWQRSSQGGAPCPGAPMAPPQRRNLGNMRGDIA